MDVEQGHHVQAAIRGPEPEHLGKDARRGVEIALGERDNLRLLGRPRRVEHEAHVVGGGRVTFARRAVVRSGSVQRQREHACLGRRCGQELDDQEAQSLCDLARRGRHPAFHHDGGDVDSSQVLLELARQVGGVERNARGAGRDTQECDRHLGPARKHDGNPIAASHAESAEGLRDTFHLGEEAPVRKRRAARREQRDGGRVAARGLGEQCKQRGRGRSLTQGQSTSASAAMSASYNGTNSTAAGANAGLSVRDSGLHGAGLPLPEDGGLRASKFAIRL